MFESRKLPTCLPLPLITVANEFEGKPDWDGTNLGRKMIREGAREKKKEREREREREGINCQQNGFSHKRHIQICPDGFRNYIVVQVHTGREYVRV